MLNALTLPAARLSPSSAGGPDQRYGSQRFPYIPAIVVCLGIGALTLLVLPTSTAYDPWSWLIWGRQLDHLTLVTRGSASAFKPMSVFIDALLAPAGHAAPDLWMAVARGATALSMVLAFEIGRRLQGVLAGVVAALALLTIADVSSYLALEGMSEPLQMCCCLAAVECGLSSRHRAATAWLVAASMLELELTGVMVLYSLIFLVWPSERRLRALVYLVLLGVLIALVWTLPDLIAGSLRAEAHLAAVPTAGGPLLARIPAWATVKEIHKMLFWPLVLGWVAELVVGTVAFVARRSLRPLFLPALFAALFVLGVALMTQLGHTTGTVRFLVAAASVGVVAAVCIWAEAIRVASNRLWDAVSARRRSSGAGGAARPGLARARTLATEILVLLVVLVGVRGGLVHWRDAVRTALHAARSQATAQKHLTEVIAAAGGAKAILACGPVYTGPDQVPPVAWTLDVPSHFVALGPARTPTGTVVSVAWSPVAIDPTETGKYHPLPTGQPAGSAWRVYSTCAS